MRFRLLQGSGSTARARVVLERRPGAAAPIGRLDLNVWLASGLAATAATAPNDAPLTAAFARLASALGTQGIVVGDLAFHDIAAAQFDHVTVEELPALFALSSSAAKTRLNVFLVQVIDGFRGYSARIGGPRANGTLASGIAVSVSLAATDDELALVMAHEIGHYLGLFHVVEADGLLTPDLISDTGPDAPNLMSAALAEVLTAGQGHVLRRHPHLRPIQAGAAKPGIAPATHLVPAGTLPPPETWCWHCAGR